MSRFLRIPPPVLYLIAAQLLLNLVNAGVVLIFNIHLKYDLDHDDATIARLTSYRYLAVLILALPTGLYLRGRRVRPLFLLGSVGMPASTLWMLSAAGRGAMGELAISFFVWGISLMALQIGVLPFILRETDEETRSEAISLSFATWAIPMFTCGVIIKVLKSGWQLSDPAILQSLVAVSFLALPLILLIRETAPTRNAAAPLGDQHDWGRIIRALAPNFLIAVGAGLTIPFVNLFFAGVFDFDSESFGLLGGMAGLPVLVGFLLAPAIRRRFGYRAAILGTQSFAVIFLVLMALTQLVRDLPGMATVAAACFLLRQPLMNMANPSSSELAQLYVGERNREILSALTASIWSGSWFFSAKIFQVLRDHDVPYWQIFHTTAGLYVVGIYLYWGLIRAHERRRVAANVS